MDLQTFDWIKRWVRGRTEVNVKDYGATGDGTTNDTTAITNALAALTAWSRLVFPPGQYLVNADTLTIPNLQGIALRGDGGARLVAATTGDFLLASSYYSTNNTGIASRGVTIDGLTLDGNAKVTHTLVVQSWRCAIRRNTIQGGITSNLRLPDSTKNGTARDGAVTQVEVSVVENVIDGAGATSYGVWSECATATDGFLRDNIVINHVVSNMRVNKGGGWNIRGNHAYNSGVTAPTGYDLHVENAGPGLRIVGNYLEDFNCMRVANISAASGSLPVISDNDFSISVPGGGGKVELAGTAASVVSLSNNNFQNVSRLRLSTVSATLNGDKFFGAQTTPWIFDAGTPTVYCRNVFVAGLTGQQIVHGPQYSSTPVLTDADESLPGILGPTTPGWSITTITLGANTAYAYRIRPKRDRTITTASFVLSTASGSNDTVQVELWDSTLTNKLTSGGTVSGKLNPSAPSIQTVPVAYTLRAGVVYYVVLSSASSTAVLQAAGYGTFRNVNLLGTAAPDIIFASAGTSHPQPGSLAAAGATGTVPLVALT